ncbi:hypothetical protein FIBSPDRAFT_940601 [Athelia psychrophila]|uniref:Uncharacterized protein n=1 Tax=Athelia psychrophila TaxID=1759441 RepID=A0A167VMY1_9AGAM|nr:hypothetical protein FIBSPDRAFT_940601 [Fibularhizoctonia sp. CBS 109695]
MAFLVKSELEQQGPRAAVFKHSLKPNRKTLPLAIQLQVHLAPGHLPQNLPRRAHSYNIHSPRTAAQFRAISNMRNRPLQGCRGKWLGTTNQRRRTSEHHPVDVTKRLNGNIKIRRAFNRVEVGGVIKREEREDGNMARSRAHSRPPSSSLDVCALPKIRIGQALSRLEDRPMNTES